MVHYIRFLRTPQVSVNIKKGLDVTAVVAVTTDLGDAYLGADTDLVARLVDATRSGEIIQVQSVPWREGMRAAKFNVHCPVKFVSRLVRMQVTTESTMSVVAEQNIPDVLDVWSEAFVPKVNTRTEPIVERQLSLPGKCQIRMWEETGDSIARHIW